MKEENQLNYATPTENTKQFFSMFINENSTIVILSPFLEGKSMKHNVQKSIRNFLLELKPHFQQTKHSNSNLNAI